MRIVTYATHSEGTFENLINARYFIDVVGWGEKWDGYIGKAKST